MSATMMDTREAAAAVGGKALGAPAGFSGVASDTRILAAGDLFVALRGERFDGHQFVSAVLSKGAAGAIMRSEERRVGKECV